MNNRRVFIEKWDLTYWQAINLLGSIIQSVNDPFCELPKEKAYDSVIAMLFEPYFSESVYEYDPDNNNKHIPYTQDEIVEIERWWREEFGMWPVEEDNGQHVMTIEERREYSKQWDNGELKELCVNKGDYK